MIHNKKALATSLLVLLALAFTAFPIASAADSSIVDIAVSDPSNFSTLVTALTAADLVGALNGTDQFTVFAPTNAAFAALPPGVLDYLLGNVSALSEVLTYHVVSGKALSSSLSNGQTIATLMGETITVKIDGKVMINDANVATADVGASNGVIHVIDKVLVPQSVINTLATVVMLPTSGGTTNPAPGTYVYGKSTNIVLSATAASGYKFSYWIAAGTITPGHTTSQGSSIVDPDTGQVIAQFPRPSTSQIDSLVFTANPANITCGYGYTYQYQAVFTPLNQPSPSPGSMDAVVIVMPTTGGTVNPSPGTYTYANNAIVPLSATPDSGYVFKYWLVSGDNTPGHGAGGFSSIADPDTGQIIAQFPRPDVSGIDTLTFTTDTLRITCGYGYTYTYTAIFEKATTKPSIVDIAIADPNNFSTLVTALTKANLVSALNGTDVYTVFAPTNAAFAALPSGVLDYLLGNVSALSEVLTYHVVSGKALSSSLSNGQTITTLLGEIVTVKISGNVMINDAKVTAADVEASNGVIHVIDKVLVPQSVLNTLPTASPTASPTPVETHTPTESSGTDMTLIIVAVVAIIAVIAVVIIMMMRRKK